MAIHKKKILDIYPSGGRKKKEDSQHFSPPEKKIPIIKPEKSFLSKRIFIIALLLLTFSVLLFCLVGVRAKIEIWPRGKEVNQETKLDISSKTIETNVKEGVIPGQYVSKEKEGSNEFFSSGSVKKEEKARGKIKVFNNYHLSQVLVERTRFLSADGKLFYSLKAITVSAGQNLEVEVEAAEAGPEYNIKPTTFSIPGLVGSPRYTVVYGKSSEEMRGGFSQTVPRVTKNDLEKAEKSTFDALSVQTKEELLKEQPDSLIILSNSLEAGILEKSSSLQEGAEAEKFSYRMKIRVKGLAFRRADLEEFAEGFVFLQFADKKIIKDMKTEFSFGQVDLGSGNGKLNLKLTARVFSDIDKGILKESLSGKPLREAETLLNQFPEIEKYRIRIFPFWQKKIPEKLEIKLMID